MSMNNLRNNCLLSMKAFSLIDFWPFCANYFLMSFYKKAKESVFTIRVYTQKRTSLGFFVFGQGGTKKVPFVNVKGK